MGAPLKRDGVWKLWLFDVNSAIVRYSSEQRLPTAGWLALDIMVYNRYSLKLLSVNLSRIYVISCLLAGTSMVCDTHILDAYIGTIKRFPDAKVLAGIGHGGTQCVF